MRPCPSRGQPGRAVGDHRRARRRRGPPDHPVRRPLRGRRDWADVSPEGTARWVQRVWRAVHGRRRPPAPGVWDRRGGPPWIGVRGTAGVVPGESGEPAWPDDPELVRVRPPDHRRGHRRPGAVPLHHRHLQADGVLQRSGRRRPGGPGRPRPAARRRRAPGPCQGPAGPVRFRGAVAGPGRLDLGPPAALAGGRRRAGPPRAGHLRHPGRRQSPRPAGGPRRRPRGRAAELAMGSDCVRAALLADRQVARSWSSHRSSSTWSRGSPTTVPRVAP